MTRPRIAVVGSGVAGLTAAYVLQRDADVTLYEADERLGGHADTHDVPAADGRLLGIDTGFIVHNERTYPLLRRLFGELGVATQESDMSMSISCGGCGLEYAGGRGAVRPAALGAHRHEPALPADAARGGALSPRGPRAAGASGRRADGARVPGRRRFSAVLRRALHDAADRGRLVDGADAHRRLSGALPVRVPRQPRHAQRHAARRRGAPSPADRRAMSSGRPRA